MIFLNFGQLSRKIFKCKKYYGWFCSLHSTGLSLGYVVGGIPGAQNNTGALRKRQEVLAQAAINTLEKKEMENCAIRKFNFPNVLMKPENL